MGLLSSHTGAQSTDARVRVVRGRSGAQCVYARVRMCMGPRRLGASPYAQTVPHIGGECHSAKERHLVRRSGNCVMGGIIVAGFSLIDSCARYVMQVIIILWSHYFVCINC